MRLSLEADLRRTRLTWGEATLLSGHAGDPRAATGDTTSVGQTEVDNESKSQPAASPGTYRPDRTSPSGLADVDSETYLHFLYKVEGLVDRMVRGGSSPLERIENACSVGLFRRWTR
jgi:hypothetical protein